MGLMRSFLPLFWGLLFLRSLLRSLWLLLVLLVGLFRFWGLCS